MHPDADAGDIHIRPDRAAVCRREHAECQSDRNRGERAEHSGADHLCRVARCAPTVATLANNSQVTLRDDGTGDPKDIYDAADRQRGVLKCTWGATEMTDSGYDQGLTLTIVPDAASEFQSAISGIDELLSPDVKDTAGSQSVYNCQVENPGYACNAEMLVGTSWVGVSLNTDDGTVTKPQAHSRIQSVLSTLASKLGAAPAATAAWPIPDTTLPGFCGSSGATAQLRGILHSPHLEKGGDVPLNGAEQVSQSEPTFADCSWETGEASSSSIQYVGVAILQGGSWLLPILTADEPTAFYAGKDAPITVAGASQAVLGCGQGQCLLTFSAGDDAYEVSVDDAGNAKTPATLAALVKLVTGS